MSEKKEQKYPIVSCIMPTFNRRKFASRAIKYFKEQDYPNKELIIVDDGTDKIKDIISNDPQVVYIQHKSKTTVGEKRNIAIENSNANIILHWDDDDWQSRHRITYQVEQLLLNDAEVCGNDKLFFYDLRNKQLWFYRYPTQKRKWLAGETLCYTREFWKDRKFDNVDVGEDSRFIWKKTSDYIFTLPDYNFCVAIVHDQNTSPKTFSGSYWSKPPDTNIKSLLGNDYNFYSEFYQKKYDHCSSRALVATAGGIGDILRSTPIIKILNVQGYAVDLLLSPDYPEVASLFENASEVANIYKKGSEKYFVDNGGETLTTQQYDLAVFAKWALPFQSIIKAIRKITFDEIQWFKEGDFACIKSVAEKLNWEKPIPPPFAITSNRNFNLAPGTIALHPGCKPDWPWKKWHGFDELARLLHEVVIIGRKEDLDNKNTYFNREFSWPEHAKSYIDSLNLCDTAALISQCSALVANDSGIMHLGATLGIPTFGIFGITNPDREIMPLENMIPVSQELLCQKECRKLRWGSRNCRFEFECLKTLTPEYMKECIDKKLKPDLIIKKKKIALQDVDRIKIKYYGYVFDSTGYGNAARAYIHALDSAGVSLSVVNLSNNGKQVDDPLVEKLINKPLQPDFHLFHFIPFGGSEYISNLSQTIVMTVWETDTMPHYWRHILNRVREVWLPCDFNITSFKNRLKVPLFKLPHVFYTNGNDGRNNQPAVIREIKNDVFVFYSIFDWQDRKNPLGLLTAYLRAVKNNDGTLLFIKTNPNAAGVAYHDLERIRRETGSKADVKICCESWNDDQIEALHYRGDCYISLHRGEGWGIPAFVAAGKGKPVIATGYSGPLEYLDPDLHSLVKYRLTEVQQRYSFYNNQMRWAEPDLEHACELICWTNNHREQAKENAKIASQKIKKEYSLKAIGLKARDHLLNLKNGKSIQENRNIRIVINHNLLGPYPSDWFDKDYFENGKKSNWKEGYTWPVFAGLFNSIADFLCTTFSNAESFLDIGCAKGFLIHALRKKGKIAYGFDHSKWAVTQAIPLVKSFIKCVGVDDVQYDRKFDILLAFEVLSQLSESQASLFLERAKNWTNIGLFAVIPTFNSETEINNYRKNSNDFSHIILKPHDWWHNLFLRTGWKQDKLHKLIQEKCQNNPLPKEMNWTIYLYSAGN